MAKSPSKAKLAKIADMAAKSAAINHLGSELKDRHYTLIIKAKRGELLNLRHLKDSTKGRLTPLFELVPKPQQEYDALVSELCQSIAASWGTLPYFADVRYIGHGQVPDAQSILTFCSVSRTLGLQAIPVTSLTFSPQFQTAIGQICVQDQRGFVLRLSVEDFTNTSQLSAAIQGLLNVTTVVPGSIDIVLDYGHRASEAELIQFATLHLASLPNVDVWRSISIASASMPSSISTMPMNIWHAVPRVEWLAWLAVRAQRSQQGSRVPSYADYGIRGISTGEAIQNTPAPNIRYTSEQICLVRRGPKNQQQIDHIAQNLVSRPEFCGSAFSFGDLKLAQRATGGSPNDGAAEAWILWCMNHHSEFVVQQLASLP